MALKIFSLRRLLRTTSRVRAAHGRAHASVAHPGGGGRPQRGGQWAAKAVKRPPQQPAQPPVRPLLSPADAETTPQGSPAAAADRKQRPDATCEGKNG